MKKLKFIPIAILIFLGACQQKQNKRNTEAEKTKTTAEKPNDEIGSFNIDKFPVSTAEIGGFPYLSTPDGYEYKYEKKKSFEEKYFFHTDSLVTKIGGNYFFSTIWKKESNEGEYEKTFVLKSYENAIKNLGATQIYAGTLPEQGKSLIDKEKPAYFKDLSENYSATYKQYLLRTLNGNIWFELFAVDNEQEIRLSVIQEEGFKQTITILKASEIKIQLDKSGKAILYINFDTDKSSLKNGGITAIEEIAKVLVNDKALNLSIEGHTDNTGNASHNKSLSTDRAHEVLKKLIELKIEDKRLKAVGYGAEKPLVTNDTEENKAKNRRVELVKI